MKSNEIVAVERPLKPSPYDKSHNRKAIGECSEAMITARLVALGYNVLKPYGDNLRYDLVIEDADRHLWRIQCKTGHLEPDEATINFSASSSYAHTRTGQAGQAHKNYQGQIDYFAVYCPATNGMYLIPIDCIQGNEGSLRLKPTASGRERNMRWAKDYEL